MTETVTIRKLVEAELADLGDPKYWTERESGYASALKWLLRRID